MLLLKSKVCHCQVNPNTHLNRLSKVGSVELSLSTKPQRCGIAGLRSARVARIDDRRRSRVGRARVDRPFMAAAWSALRQVGPSRRRDTLSTTRSKLQSRGSVRNGSFGAPPDDLRHTAASTAQFTTASLVAGNQAHRRAVRGAILRDEDGVEVRPVEGRGARDSVIIVGIALRFHQRLLASGGATSEVGALLHAVAVASRCDAAEHRP